MFQGCLSSVTSTCSPSSTASLVLWWPVLAATLLGTGPSFSKTVTAFWVTAPCCNAWFYSKWRHIWYVFIYQICVFLIWFDSLQNTVLQRWVGLAKITTVLELTLHSLLVSDLVLIKKTPLFITSSGRSWILITSFWHCSQNFQHKLCWFNTQHVSLFCPYYISPMDETEALGKSIKEVRSTTAGSSPPPPMLSSEMIEMARSCPCCLKILRWSHEDCVLLETCRTKNLLRSGKLRSGKRGRIKMAE